MASTKEVAQLIRTLRKRKIPVTKTEGGHWLVQCPNGQGVIMQATPSDWRGWRNTKARLKRNGVDLTRPHRKAAP